ncbi:MAG: hypothetical protein Q4C81_00035 [Kocuria sp.]|nr:hypothetical protein [Kocuria sp.]
MGGSSRTRGLIKGHGRHRDSEANAARYPRALVSSSGVPVYVTMAAGAVVAGLITTAAPSTTAETLRTDLVPPQDIPTGQFSAGAWETMPHSAMTAYPKESGGAQALRTGPTAESSSALPKVTTSDEDKNKNSARPSRQGVLRAGAKVRDVGRGIGSVFSAEEHRASAKQSEQSATSSPAPTDVGRLSAEDSPGAGVLDRHRAEPFPSLGDAPAATSPFEQVFGSSPASEPPMAQPPSPGTAEPVETPTDTDHNTPNTQGDPITEPDAGSEQPTFPSPNEESSDSSADTDEQPDDSAPSDFPEPMPGLAPTPLSDVTS